jgi:23S rRNA (cytidine2498-2'-O)-methyltransferase
MDHTQRPLSFDPTLADASGQCTAYLAAPGFLPDLVRELGDAAQTLGRLAIHPGPAREAAWEPAWAQNIWYNPRVVPFTSINQAAKALKTLGSRWVLYDEHLERRGRAKLIQQQVRAAHSGPVRFGQPLPTPFPGSWTLLDDRTLFAASRCSSPFPHGEARFVEDKTGPPSRAYLKLWELFTIVGQRPGPGQLCLDLGASPGGWTWVLHALGARVISVDKAPLAPGLAGRSGIIHRPGSAFDPGLAEIGPVDWLFSDVICYPDRLLGLVRQWLDRGAAPNMVCTIKFQGETDGAAVERFRSIPGSRLIHLAHNKHELTWVWGQEVMGDGG